MYEITNTFPVLTEAESAELKAAAARAIHTTLIQLIGELQE